MKSEGMMDYGDN